MYNTKLFYCLILLLSWTSFELNAQTKFTFGVSFYPNFSDYQIVESGDTPSVIVGIFEEVEVPKLSYAAGLLIGLEVGPQVLIQTGFNWVNAGVRTQEKEFITEVPEPSLPNAGYFVDRKSSIEIPLLFQYALISRGVHQWYLQLGPSFWVDVNNQRFFHSIYENQPKEVEEVDLEFTFSRWNIIGNIGAGYSYNAEKITFFIGPKFQYSFLNIVEELVPLDRRIITYGIVTGIRF